MATEKPTPVFPFPPGILSANLAEIPRWKDTLPITQPNGPGINLETAWAKVSPGMAFSPIQQGKLGTCVPQTVSHAIRVTSWGQGKDFYPMAEWLYWVARRGMPTDEPQAAQGCAFYNAIRASQYIGAPCYGPQFGGYDADRAFNWGDNGPPPEVAKAQRFLPRIVRRICSPEEFVSAINARHAIATYGNWSFFNNDKAGIITGPNVSPHSIPKGASPLSMWGHAMSAIGYRILNGKIYGGWRNHSATKLHTGGQDALFPLRGTGLMDLADPIIQWCFEKFTMVSLGGILPFTPLP